MKQILEHFKDNLFTSRVCGVNGWCRRHDEATNKDFIFCYFPYTTDEKSEHTRFISHASHGCFTTKKTFFNSCLLVVQLTQSSCCSYLSILAFAHDVWH